MKSRLVGGIFGHCAGDALGLPVEYRSRQYLRENPVISMFGYGTHNQPVGTWSDDSSLMLCTVEALCEGYDLEQLARKLVAWYSEGHWAAHGEVFDVDGVTKVSLELLRRGVVGPGDSGVSRTEACGNGALIRMLPFVWQPIFSSVDVLLEHARVITSITHAHECSAVASALFLLMCRHLLRGYDAAEAYRRTCYVGARGLRRCPMSDRFSRLLDGGLVSVEEADITSSGSCVDTLECAIWSLLHTDSFSEAVITAVNLGGDTDTVGALTGGLAGLYYGAAAIPSQWIRVLARKKEIMKLALRYMQVLSGSEGVR